MIRIGGIDRVSSRLKWRRGRPGPDARRWAIRPDDLVVLGFDLVNLEVRPSQSQNENATLVRKSPGDAYLVVWFPPQHITEQAYFTTVDNYPVALPVNAGQTPPLSDPDKNSGSETPDPPPIDAIISGWSRLAFRVPDAKLPIDWTFAGLLAAIRDLELSVPVNALPPKQPRLFYRDVFTGIADRAELSAVLIAASPSIFEAAAGLPVAGASRMLAVARSRRKARTVGNALGLSITTGTVTRDIGLMVEEAVTGPALSPYWLRPEPTRPHATQTSLEVPYQVILSPNRHGAWFHSPHPVTSDATGQTELWHTRLGVRRDDGTLVDGDHPLRKIRAVWTTDSPAPQTPEPDQPVSTPGHGNLPFRMSLDSFDRHNVVHLSSNFRLRDGKNPNKSYDPPPIDVDLLALTSLGAWVDTRGAWDFPQPVGLSVEEWRHRATLGRDHYVRVVYSGFLFPFGHRASLVKISERQFHAHLPGNPAYVRQRMFLIVREPVKTFRNTGLKYDGPDTKRTGEQYDLMMPFEAVRLLTRVSPLLDPPETDDIADSLQSAFWPYVGGQPFKFHVLGTDVDGNPVDMSMPLIFVGKEKTDAPYDSSMLPTQIVQAYETAVWPGGTKRATVPILGQKLAYADGSAPSDTTLRRANADVRRRGAGESEVRAAWPAPAPILPGRAAVGLRCTRIAADRPHHRSGEPGVRRRVPARGLRSGKSGRGLSGRQPGPGRGQARRAVQFTR